MESNEMRRLPPQSIEAEMSILGAVFLDNECIETVHDYIAVDDIYRQSHRLIFSAMSYLAEHREPIDLVTMVTELRKRGQLEEIGGGAYLATLVEYVAVSGNVAFYCKTVKGHAEARRLIIKAQEGIELAYEGRTDEANEKLENALEPTFKDQRNSPVSVQVACGEAIRRIEHRYENKEKLTGLSYGLQGLDKVTNGAQPGDLIIIAARPAMGKSALLGNIFRTAGEDKQGGLLFNLEMSKLDNVDRIAASYGIPYQNIRSGRLQENDWPKLSRAMGAIHDWNLWIDDTPAISLRELRAKARKIKRQHDISIIGIDYLQLMSLSDPRQSRQQGLGEISRGLKQLAKELGVPIIALSQLNRSLESRPDKRPLLSDLRESGDIEQDADLILFPFRPAVYCDKCKDRIDDAEHKYAEHQSKAELIIGKHRAGESNLSIPLCWLGPFQKFVGLHKAEE